VNELTKRNIETLRFINLFGLHLIKMSMAGMPISFEVLAFKSEGWKRKIREHEEKVFEKFGVEFNLNSSDQKKAVLYGIAKDFEEDNSTKARILCQELARKSFQFKPEYKRVFKDDSQTWVDENKVSTDKYSISKLHYEHKAAYDGLFYNWRRALLLDHRRKNFVDKLLLHDPCKSCGGKGKIIGKEKYEKRCDACIGTGLGKPVGINPDYISERNGWYYLHSDFMQLAVTGRTNSLSPNLYQWPRDEHTYDIQVRDCMVAPPGWKLHLRDLSKAEFRTAAIIFDDPIMLSKADSGSRAFSEPASRFFSLPIEDCGKNTSEYFASKTAHYLCIYGGQGAKLHEVLMKSDCYIPIPKCQEIIDSINEEHVDYVHNGKVHAWKCYKRGWVVNIFGRRFKLVPSPELEGYDSWEGIEKRGGKNARRIWSKVVKTVLSFTIQGTATGDQTQISGIKCSQAIDKLVNPHGHEWNPFEQGDINKAYLAGFKHDEPITHCREEYVQDIDKLTEEILNDFGNGNPYVDVLLKKDWGMKSESESSRIWGVPDSKYDPNLTKMNSPEHFWQNGIRLKL